MSFMLKSLHQEDLLMYDKSHMLVSTRQNEEGTMRTFSQLFRDMARDDLYEWRGSTTVPTPKAKRVNY